MLESLSPEEKQRRKNIDKALYNYDGFHVNFNITAQPFLQQEDSTGILSKKDIDSGRFKVFMNLMAYGNLGKQGEVQKYLISQNVPEISREGGTAFTWKAGPHGLLASVPMVLMADSSYGRVELAIKIVPIEYARREGFLCGL